MITTEQFKELGWSSELIEEFVKGSESLIEQFPAIDDSSIGGIYHHSSVGSGSFCITSNPVASNSVLQLSNR